MTKGKVRTSVELNPGQSEKLQAIAARLGFETSGTDLGLLDIADPGRIYERPVVVVGSRALAELGLGGEAEGVVSGLGPGQGAVVHFPPGRRLLGGGVAVVGYDATGLLEAASYLSGRYPAVWGHGGPVW